MQLRKLLRILPLIFLIPSCSESESQMQLNKNILDPTIYSGELSGGMKIDYLYRFSGDKVVYNGNEWVTISDIFIDKSHFVFFDDNGHFIKIMENSLDAYPESFQYVNGLYFLLSKGKLYSSPDLINFTENSYDDNSNKWNLFIEGFDIYWTGKEYIASIEGYLQYSNDGIAWNIISNSYCNYGYGECPSLLQIGNSIFVNHKNADTIVTLASNVDINLHILENPSGEIKNQITIKGNEIIYFAQSGNVYSSENGKNWLLLGETNLWEDLNKKYIQGPVFHKNKFYIFYYVKDMFYISTDGLNWTSEKANFYTGIPEGIVANDKGGMLLIDSYTFHHFGNDNEWQSIRYINGRKVTYNHNQFVFTPSSTSTHREYIIVSNDLEKSKRIAIEYKAIHAIYDGEKYIVACDEEKLAIIKNYDITYYELPINFQYITQNNFGYYATSREGHIFYSEDGYEWIIQLETEDEKLYKICEYENKLFGLGTGIYISENGKDWTKNLAMSLEPDEDFRDMIFHDGKYYFTASRYIYQTSDLKNWQIVDFGYDNKEIEYTGKDFIMISKNKLAASTDGLNWTEIQEFGRYDKLYELLWFNDKLIITNNLGSVIALGSYPE